MKPLDLLRACGAATGRALRPVLRSAQRAVGSSATLSVVGLIFALTHASAQTVLFAPNGGAVGSNTTNSNVGIGTATPGAKLTVSGTSYPFWMLEDTGNQNFVAGRSDGFVFFNSAGNYTISSQGYASRGLPTGDTARLTILGSNGNVGIGTTSPGIKLSVAGGGGYTGVQIGSESGGAYLRWSREGRTGDANKLNIYDQDANAVIATFQSGGNVGIGTTTPDTRLKVVSAGSLAGIHVNASGVADTPAIIYENSWLTGTKWLTAIGYDSGLFLGTKVVGASQYAFVVASSGNVGIGTASPAHKLAVNGTIKAREVIVETTGWSDHVFGDDYQLAPLSAVEAHIKEKKHLPGIPSAAEVEAGGVSLGDMQAKLLAKVEELTLHLIRVDKDNAAQAARIASLEKENASLQRQLAVLGRTP